MEVLSKDMIERWITPHLSKGARGPKRTVETADIIRAIFYRLKTGCQWRMLPLREFFEGRKISWNGVYYHHHQWVSDGSWRRVWVSLLKGNKHLLDLSSMQLDGSQTPAKKQGENISYQRRRKARTTNALFLSDNRGQPIAMAAPQAGNHNDLYEVETLFSQMCELMKEAEINLDGVFMNADAGFDAESLRRACSERNIEANIDQNPRNTTGKDGYLYFDEELYKRRYVIEQTNAWIDGFKALLVRYEGKVKTWMQQHFMAFAILLLRKLLIVKP
jgi:transposase